MPRRYYSSTAARTTLASGVNDSATSFSVVAVSGWPESFPYTLIVDQDTVNEEIVQVTARSGTSLTVVRAVDGTTGVAHSAGAAVNHGVSARDFNEPNQFLNEGGTVTGPTVVDVNSSSAALRVTQVGAGNALVVEDSANPDSTPFVVNANGNVGIGTSSPATTLNVYEATLPVINLNNSTSGTTSNDGLTFTLFGSDGYLNLRENGSLLFYTNNTERLRITSAGNVGIGTTAPIGLLHTEADGANQTFLARNSTDANSSSITFRKRRGTASSPTVVADGDGLGILAFQGYDGANLRLAAQIAASVDGTPGVADMPGSLIFYTTADGASSPTQRMKINNAGLITGTGPSLGAWTAYTPTLSVWTLGNGTITGAYCQIGKVVQFRVQIVVGSTTTIGASPTFTIPVNMSGTNPWNVRGYFRDISGAAIYDLTARPSSTSTIGCFYTGTNGQHLSFNATTPFTWESGDVLILAGTYEAA